MRIIVFLTIVLLGLKVSLASNASDRYFYLGTEIGISEPIVKKFIHKADHGDTTIRLKRSHMYGGRIGYGFYPNMAIEISGTHQPKFRLGYILPSIDITSTVQEMVAQSISQQSNIPMDQARDMAKKQFPSAKIPTLGGTTRVSTNVFTLNLIYEFGKQRFDITPYAIFGAGIAMINIRPTNTNWTPDGDLSKLPGFNQEIPFFRLNKNRHNCFTYQFGVGLVKEINPNFAIDLSAKIQVVQNITIKYESLDMAQQKFVSQEPIRKTLGVGEFTIGFTWKIPS